MSHPDILLLQARATEDGRAADGTSFSRLDGEMLADLVIKECAKLVTQYEQEGKTNLGNLLLQHYNVNLPDSFN